MHYTPEQLQAAWLRCRRGHWPTSFEAVMADPLLGRLVRMHACAKAQADLRRNRWGSTPAAPASQPAATLPTAVAPTAAPTAKTTAAAAAPTHRPTRPTFDARRAAANDLDPDDDEE